MNPLRSPRWPALLLLAVAALLVLDWIGSRPFVERGAGPAEPDRAAAPSAVQHGAANREPEVFAPEAAPGREALATSSEASAATEAGGAVPDEVLVTVVDSSDRPLAGVFVVLQATVPGWFGQLAPRVLARAVTGPSGEPARVPLALARDGTARSGDTGVPEDDGATQWSLCAELPRADGPCLDLESLPEPGGTFRLVVDDRLASWTRPLTVRVLDASGAPMPDIPVEARAWRELEQTRDEPRVLSSTRAPDGACEFHLGCLWKFTAGARALHVGMRYEVRCRLPMTPPCRVELDPRGPAPERIDLVLPPTGWIDLRVDGDGVDAVDVDCFRVGSNGGSVSARVRGGRVRVGPLGLGWRVNLTVRDARPGGGSISQEVAGPTAEGEVVAVRMAFESKLTPLTFRGTALAPPGSEWGPPPLQMLVHLEPSRLASLASGAVDVAAGGSFAWETGLDEAQVEELESGSCALRFWKRAGAPDWVSFEGAVPLVGAIPADGIWRIGTVQLTSGRQGRGASAPNRRPTVLPGDRVLAGRVLALDGHALAGAEVRLNADANEPKQPRPVGETPPLQVSVFTGIFPLTRFERIRRTDAQGRFRFGDLPEDPLEYQLRARARGHRSAKAKGTLEELADRDVVLEPDSWIAGRVLLDPEIAMDRLRVVLGSGRDTELHYLAGAFYIGGLTPPVERVRIVLADAEETKDTGWTVWEARDVLLVAGRASPDPRLREIDLRGKICIVRFELRFDGEPAPQRWIGIRDQQGRGWDKLMAGSDGRLAALVPAFVESLTLQVDGFSAVAVSNTSELQRIDLTR